MHATHTNHPAGAMPVAALVSRADWFSRLACAALRADNAADYAVHSARQHLAFNYALRANGAP